MNLAFVYAGGREARWNAAMAGDAPTEFFYGAVEAARAGHRVRVLDVAVEEGVGARIYNSVFGFATPAKLRGEFLGALAGRVRDFADCDVVVVTASPLAMAAGVLSRLGRLRVPVLAIHCGLVNFELASVRAKSTRWALGAQVTHVFAEPERVEMAERFGLGPDALMNNPFGVDTEFWSPGGNASGYVLAVGNDARRDYGTLVEAARVLDVPVKILTRRVLPSPLPSNVESLAGSWHSPSVTDSELRELYRGAACVVVPLDDAIQPAGQSVALQAMACGRPVVMTRTRGLWTGEDFVDGREIILVPPGDAGALGAAVRGILGDSMLSKSLGELGRAAVGRSGTIGDFSARLLASCDQLCTLGRKSI